MCVSTARKIDKKLLGRLTCVHSTVITDEKNLLGLPKSMRQD